MKKDNRQIHLDPMEWRDSMGGGGKDAAKAPAKPAARKASAGGKGKPAKGPAKKSR